MKLLLRLSGKFNHLNLSYYFSVLTQFSHSNDVLITTFNLNDIYAEIDVLLHPIAQALEESEMHQKQLYAGSIICLLRNTPSSQHANEYDEQYIDFYDFLKVIASSSSVLTSLIHCFTYHICLFE